MDVETQIREVENLIQCYTANKWQSQDSNLFSLLRQNIKLLPMPVATPEEFMF
jgi:hypothetical protein